MSVLININFFLLNFFSESGSCSEATTLLVEFQKHFSCTLSLFSWPLGIFLLFSQSKSQTNALSLSLSSLGPLGFLLSIKVSFTAFVMVNSLSSLLQCTELLDFKLNFSLFKIIWVILLFCFVYRFILYVCTGFVAQIKIWVLSKFLRFNFYNAQILCMYVCMYVCVHVIAFRILHWPIWKIVVDIDLWFIIK